MPGRAALRWRTTDEPPPAALRSTSPYALEARSSPQRDPQWVGSTPHRPEPCEPEPPALLPQGRTTPAPTPAGPLGPPIVQAWAARDLRPGPHLGARGAGKAAFRVSAPQPQSEVGGPPFGAERWHQKSAPG